MEWLLGLLIIGGGIYAIVAIVYVIRFSKRTKVKNVNKSFSESKFLNKSLACSNEGNSEIPVKNAIQYLGLTIDSLIVNECGKGNE